MKIDNKTTALVVTDPQNDFLSEDGTAWGLVGDIVRENNTIANLETLLTAARDGGYRTFVSLHYYYPAARPSMHCVGQRGHIRRQDRTGR